VAVSIARGASREELASRPWARREGLTGALNPEAHELFHLLVPAPEEDVLEGREKGDLAGAMRFLRRPGEDERPRRDLGRGGRGVVGRWRSRRSWTSSRVRCLAVGARRRQTEHLRARPGSFSARPMGIPYEARAGQHESRVPHLSAKALNCLRSSDLGRRATTATRRASEDKPAACRTRPKSHARRARPRGGSSVGSPTRVSPPLSRQGLRRLPAQRLE
jgi:hypothetical protein